MRVLATWLGIGFALLFIAGFWRFAERVREEPAPPPQAQGIVALTGGSLQRLATGVRLLEERKGERLLISGVNRIVTDAELYEVLGVDRELGDCCIDLGRAPRPPSPMRCPACLPPRGRDRCSSRRVRGRPPALRTIPRR